MFFSSIKHSLIFFCLKGGDFQKIIAKAKKHKIILSHQLNEVENYKRKIRSIFNRLEEKKYIVPVYRNKDGKQIKEGYKINEGFSAPPTFLTRLRAKRSLVFISLTN